MKKHMFYDYYVACGVFDGFIEAGKVSKTEIADTLEQAELFSHVVGIDAWTVDVVKKAYVARMEDGGKMWPLTENNCWSWVFGYMNGCRFAGVSDEMADGWLLNDTKSIFRELVVEYKEFRTQFNNTMTSTATFEDGKYKLSNDNVLDCSIVHVSGVDVDSQIVTYNEAMGQCLNGNPILPDAKPEEYEDENIYESMRELFGDDVDEIISDILCVPGKDFYHYSEIKADEPKIGTGKKKMLSDQLAERLLTLRDLANTDKEIKKQYDAMLFTYKNVKMALVDIVTKYPTEEYARQTYDRRATQLLGEIVGLDKLYVRETGEEPIYLDMNNPTKIVKMLTAYEQLLSGIYRDGFIEENYNI
jgi:hypothetical protein